MTASDATSTALSDIGISPGLMTGSVARMVPPIPEPEIATLEPSRDVEKGRERIALATQQVKKGLEPSAAEARTEARTFLKTTAQMAADPTLTSTAQTMVCERRMVPERAVWEPTGILASMLEFLGGYVAERTRDIQDVHGRIVAVLTKSPMPRIPRLPEPFVLVVTDLAPADTVLLDPEKVITFTTSEGSPTSHTATLTRALSTSAIVGTSGKVTNTLAEDDIVLVDGAKGSVVLSSSENTLHRARGFTSRVRVFNGDGITKGGHKVQLLANVGDAVSVRSAAGAGAMGIGLFRTELCFLSQPEKPTAEAQVEAHQGVLEASPGRKVMVRTLDAGADKPLSFLTDTTGANPAFDIRAYRTTRRDPEVLSHQLEALVEAEVVTEARVWVMAPMTSTAEETEAFTQRARSYGLRTTGVMIETPSAVLMANEFSEHADFASMSTNDLTQHVMVTGRLLSSLTGLSTAWQPAVLRLIGAACEGASPKGRPVGVYGKAAANPTLAAMLVGLGVASLSITARALPDVDAVLKPVMLTERQELVRIALDTATAEDACSAMRAKLSTPEELGL